MREGSVVTVKGEALEIYSGMVMSEKQEFVLEYIDEDIAYMRRVINDNLVDWRAVQAIPKTLDDTGQTLKDYVVIRPGI
jgi:hypothetical protein